MALAITAVSVLLTASSEENVKRYKRFILIRCRPTDAIAKR
jgi:hypothetical protein